MASLENQYTFTRFEEVCKEHPSKTALIYLGETFTYGRLETLVHKFARGLSDMGVKQQDRVMLYISNCPQWIIANFAINRIGAVTVPVSPIYTAFEIEYMIKDAGIETVICLDTNFVYVKEVMERTNLKRVIVTNLVDFISPFKRVVGHLFDKIPTGKVEKGDRIHFFKDVTYRSPNIPPDITIDPKTDLSYIMYTGGTTGFPKGVPGNHIGEVTYINDIMEDVIKDYVNPGNDTVLMINPLFHIMAKGFSIAFGFNYANTVVLMPIPEVDPTLSAIERYRIKWMLGVPALYRMILESDRVDQYDLSSLRYCYCGGDVLPVEVFKSWQEKYSVPLYQVYGSTEIGHVTYSLLSQEPSPTVIGTPLKTRKSIVVDRDTLEKLPPGELGELLVTSPYTLKEYLNKPEETEYSYVRLNGDIYYRMGDYVKMNERGELEFVERTADIIKYKAYRVSASEVEAALQDHPTVIGACVIGVPDPKVGERIKAIVVLKEDAKGIGSTELLKWCRDRLAPYKVPGYIEFRDMLPKSKVGKLLRREIRDEEKRKLEKEKRR
ncbi:MAG: Long-chain-fatty-acid--CoA ligase [Syntrophorhabdus sp. PtaB.Bin047]|jgi:long-chain acyl-CoA synthetase|nr:MAG: Long-chain-fatty-acid--CoA ligase [Syntrophorhabdus sp. PtaB.Bin047]